MVRIVTIFAPARVEIDHRPLYGRLKKSSVQGRNHVICHMHHLERARVQGLWNHFPFPTTAIITDAQRLLNHPVLSQMITNSDFLIQLTKETATLPFSDKF
jgi:hypothetical protein